VSDGFAQEGMKMWKYMGGILVGRQSVWKHGEADEEYGYQQMVSPSIWIFSSTNVI